MERSLLGTLLLTCLWLDATAAAYQGIVHGPNPCLDDSNEMYYPDPKNSSRYIQCTGHRRAYTRHCNYGQVWSQALRTCMPGSHTTDYNYDYKPQAGKQRLQPASGTSQYGDRRRVSTSTKQHYQLPMHYQGHGYNYYPFNYMYFPLAFTRGLLYGKNYQAGRGQQMIVKGASSKSHQASQRTNQPSSYGSTSYWRPPMTLHSMSSGRIHRASSSSSSMAAASSWAASPRSKGKTAFSHAYYVQPTPKPTRDSRCADPTVRYLPHPTGRSKYYECHAGELLVRSCAGSTVWVQPMRTCVDLTNRLSLTVPMANPCAGSDATYKPYPANPSKYIECRDVQSVLVWTCKPTNIWVQHEERCMATNALQSAVPPRANIHRRQYDHVHHTQAAKTARTTYTGGAGGVRGGGYTICDNTTYYFANPNNRHSFIQCDYFGNTFTLPCASGTAWDDAIKACVKEMGVQPHHVDAMQVTTSITGGNGAESTNYYDFDFSEARPLQASNYYDDHQATNYGLGQTVLGGDAKSYQYHQYPNYVNNRAYTGRGDAQAGMCRSGDLWIPSMRACVSLSEAIKEYQGCLPGDYYFKHYHICASIRYSSVEEKSGGSGQGVYTYTNYDSYLTDDARQSAGGGGDSAGSNRCASRYKGYGGPNPCGTNDTYYYDFDEDPNCFIQCNQLGTMFIMSCPSSCVWNQQAGCCVNRYDANYDRHDLESGQYHGGDTMRASGRSAYSGGGSATVYDRAGGSQYGTSIAHVCANDSETRYKEHPENAHKFIMCFNSLAYPMWCPHTNLWRQDIQTCFWPTSAHHHHHLH